VLMMGQEQLVAGLAVAVSAMHCYGGSSSSSANLHFPAQKPTTQLHQASSKPGSYVPPLPPRLSNAASPAQRCWPGPSLSDSQCQCSGCLSMAAITASCADRCKSHKTCAATRHTFKLKLNLAGTNSIMLVC